MDHATIIRQALITAMKSHASLQALVGDRIHDQVSSSPTWDFIRFDPPDQQKYESSCGIGRECEWRIHIFGRGPGTKNILGIEAEVFSFMEDVELSIDAFSRLDIDFVRSSTGPDGDEPNDYHTVMVYRTISVQV